MGRDESKFSKQKIFHCKSNIELGVFLWLEMQPPPQMSSLTQVKAKSGVSAH
jgi:hypothetical protein